MIDQLLAGAIVLAYFAVGALIYWGAFRFAGAPLGRRLDDYMTDLLGMNRDDR